MAFSFSAFADAATSSNAILGSVPQKYLLSAESLSDDDSGIMPYSSIGTVTNTVDLDLNDVYVWVHYTEVITENGMTTETDMGCKAS